MVASDEITGLVKDYMEGGDQDGFGQNDPWALLPHGDRAREAGKLRRRFEVAGKV